VNASRFLFIDDVEKMAEHELHSPPEGISLPWWRKFSERVGGLRLGEFSVITAATGAGKTTILANLVAQAVQTGHGVYVCSAEIGAPRFLIAMWSALEKKSLGDGTKYSREYAAEVREKYATLLRTGRLIFSRHDDRIAPKALIEETEEAITKLRAKFLILDNLQFFMPIVSGNQQIAETDKVVREFARQVRRRPVHTLLIAHPRKGEVASEDSIKGSNTLGQEADNIFLLHRLTKQEIDDSANQLSKLDRRLECRKMRRRGWIAGESFHFRFNGGRYDELLVRWNA
jgi:RecA-family ATPase